jgi:hypothetical protein
MLRIIEGVGGVSDVSVNGPKFLCSVIPRPINNTKLYVSV